MVKKNIFQCNLNSFLIHKQRYHDLSGHFTSIFWYSIIEKIHLKLEFNDQVFRLAKKSLN